MQQPMKFWCTAQFLVGSINIEFPLKGNTLFPGVPVQNMLFKHIAKGLMPFETFVHACLKQCLQPDILSSIVVVSSDEEFVTTEIVEEFAAIEAFELSGEE